MKDRAITLKPPGHWNGDKLHTKNHTIEFKGLTAKQKAKALEDLKNGRLKIKKLE